MNPTEKPASSSAVTHRSVNHRPGAQFALRDRITDFSVEPRGDAFAVVQGAETIARFETAADATRLAEALRLVRPYLLGSNTAFRQVEALTWNNAAAFKPPADIPVLLIFVDERDGPLWTSGWWDSDAQVFRLAESGGVANGLVRCWAYVRGPGGFDLEREQARSHG